MRDSARRQGLAREGERDQDHKTTRERGTSFNNDGDPYGKLAPPSRWRRVPTSYTLTDLLTLSDSFQIGVCRPSLPPIHLCSLLFEPFILAFRRPFVVFEQSACFSHALREPTMRFRSDVEWSVGCFRWRCHFPSFWRMLFSFFADGMGPLAARSFGLVNCVNFRKIDLTFPFTLRSSIRYVSPL